MKTPQDLIDWINFIEVHPVLMPATAGPADHFTPFSIVVRNTSYLLQHVAKVQSWEKFPDAPLVEQLNNPPEIGHSGGAVRRYLDDVRRFCFKKMFVRRDSAGPLLSNPPGNAAKIATVSSPSDLVHSLQPVSVNHLSTIPPSAIADELRPDDHTIILEVGEPADASRPLTGEVLAARMRNFKFDSQFKGRLSKLVKMKLLDNSRGRGYFLTPNGTEVVNHLRSRPG